MLTSVTLLDQLSIVRCSKIGVGDNTAKDNWLPLLLLYIFPGFLVVMAKHPRNLALEVPLAKTFPRDEASCGGLNENGPHRLIGSGLVGGTVLLEGGGRDALRFQKLKPGLVAHCLFLPPAIQT